MSFTRAIALVLILQLFFPLALLAQAQDLDLSSTARNQTVSLAAPVDITVGGTTRTVNHGDSLSHAEYVALQQVLSGGSITAQTIEIHANGNATGGTLTLNGFSSLGHLIIPDGVTAVHDFGSSSTLSLTGNLNNSGNFYAVSTNPAVTNATLGALNINNQASGLLTTVLPTGGLAGYGSAISNLSLTLNAVQNIVNYGTISSAAALSMTAGTSINNASTTAVMQAVNNMSFQAPSIVNLGTFSSSLGSINVATANLQNSNLMQALNGTLSVANTIDSSGLNVTSGASGVLNALAIQFNPTTALLTAPITIDGGTFNAATISINAGQGNVYINNGAQVKSTGALTVTTSGAGNMAVSAGSLLKGTSITATANDVSIAGLLDAGTGAVTLAPNGAKAITVGGAAPAGTFTISNSDLAAIQAGALTLGNRTLSGSIALGGDLDFSSRPYTLSLLNDGNYDSAGFAVTTGARNYTVDVGGAISTGAITGTTSSTSLTSVGAITQTGGSVSSNGVTLKTTGSGSNIGTAATPFVINANAAGVFANGNAYIFDTDTLTLSGSNVTGILEVRTAGNIATANSNTAGTLLLDAAGTITQSSGTLNATSLEMRAGSGTIGTAANYFDVNVNGSVPGSFKVISPGSVYIQEVDNLDLGASTVTGDLFIAAGNAIKTSGNVTATGVINLQTNAGFDLTLGSNLNASSIILQGNGSSTADILGAGILTANAITLNGTGSVGISTAPITTVTSNLTAVGSGGSVYVTNTGATFLSGSAASTFDVKADNSITTNGAISSADLILQTTANNGSLNLNHNVTGSTSVSLTTNGTGAITQSAERIVGGSLVITANGDIGSAVKALDTTISGISFNTLGSAYISENDTLIVTGTTSAGGTLDIKSANTLTINGTLSATDIRLATTANNGAIALNQNVTGTGSIVIGSHGSGDITHGGGVLTSPTVTLTSTSGNIGASSIPVVTPDPLNIYTNTALLTASTTGGVHVYNASGLNATVTSNGALSFTTLTGDINLTVSASPIMSLYANSIAGNTTINSDILTTPVLAGDGGAVTLMAFGNVTARKITTTGNNTGTGGAISLVAGQNLTVLDINSSSGINSGSGGNINLVATAGLVNAGTITASAESPADVGTGGAITVLADRIQVGAIDNHSDWGNGDVTLTATNGMLVNGTITSWTSGANSLFAPFTTDSSNVTLKTTQGDIIVNGSILTYNASAQDPLDRGLLNAEGGTIDITGGTGVVKVSGNMETWGVNDAFGGLVKIQLNGGSLDITGKINTSAQNNSGGDVIISGAGGPITLNSAGLSTGTAIKTSSDGTSSHFAGTTRILVPNANVTVTGGIDGSSTRNALAGDVLAQTNSLLVTGLIDTSAQKRSGGTVDLSARTNLTVADVNTSAATGGTTNASGGLVMMAAGTAGLAASDLVVGNITSTGRGPNQSSGSVVLLSSGGITSGNISTAGTGGADGASVSLIGGSASTIGNITFGNVTTTGAGGGLLTVVSMGTAGTVSNGTSIITTNALSADRTAGSVTVSSVGKVSLGNISATSTAAGSTTAYGGSVFVTSGSTDAVSSTINVGNVDTTGMNGSGSLFVVHESGAAAPTLGTRTVGASFVGAPITNPGAITGDLVIRFDAATGVVENFNPGGFTSINAPTATVSLDTAGDPRLFAPIVNLSGDLNLQTVRSITTSGAASPISLYSVGAITITGAVDASAVGTQGATLSFSSNTGIINLKTINVSGDPGGTVIISTPNQFNLGIGESIIARSASGNTAGGRILIAVPNGTINLGTAGNTSNSLLDVTGATGGTIELQAASDINIYEVGLIARGTNGGGGTVQVSSLEGAVNFYQGYSGGVAYTSSIDASGSTSGGTINLYGKYGISLTNDLLLAGGPAASVFNANGVTSGGMINLYSPQGAINMRALDRMTATADATSGTGGTIQTYSSGLATVNTMNVRAANGGIIDSIAGGFDLANSHNIMADGLNGNGGSVTIYTQGVRTFNNTANITLGTVNNQTGNRVSANGTVSGGLVRMDAGNNIISNEVDVEATGTAGDGGRIRLTAATNIELLHQFFDVGTGAVYHNAQISADSASGAGGTIIMNANGNITSSRDTSITGGAVTTTSTITANGITAGGTISMIASGVVDLTQTNFVSASSTGAASTGGSVTVDAGSLAIIPTLTTSSPNGGNIRVEGYEITLLNGENVTSVGSTGNGGSINFISDTSILLGTTGNTATQLSASGANNGGTINLTGGTTVSSELVSLNANGTAANGGIINVSGGGAVTLSGAVRAEGPVNDGNITITSTNDNVDLRRTTAIDARSTGTAGVVTITAGRQIHTSDGSPDPLVTDDGITGRNVSLTTTANDGSIFIRGDVSGTNQIALSANGSGAIVHSTAINTGVLTAPTVSLLSGSGTIGARTTGTGAPVEHLDSQFVFTNAANLTASTAGNVYMNNLSTNVALGASNAGTGSNVFMLQSAGNVATVGAVTAGSSQTTSSTCCGGWNFGSTTGVGTTHLETYANNGNITIGSNVTGFGTLNLEATGNGRVTVESGMTALSLSRTNVLAHDVNIAGSLTGKGSSSWSQPPGGVVSTYYNGMVTITPNGSQTTDLGRVGGVQTAGMDIDQAEFGRITTDTLQVGSSNWTPTGYTYVNTGDVTVVNDLNLAGAGPAGVYSMYVYTGGNYKATGTTISLQTGATDNRVLGVTSGGNANTGNVSGGYYTFFDSDRTLTVDGMINNSNTASSFKYVSLNATEQANILAGSGVSTQYVWGNSPIWQNNGTINATGYAYLSNSTYVPNDGPIPTNRNIVVTGTGSITAPDIYFNSSHYSYDPVTFANVFYGGNVSVTQGALNGNVRAWGSKGTDATTGNISVTTTNSNLTIGSISGSNVNLRTSGNHTVTVPTLSHETISIQTGTLSLGGNLTATAGNLTIESAPGSTTGLTITGTAQRTLRSPSNNIIRANDGPLTIATSLRIDNASVTLQAAGTNGAININPGVAVSSDRSITANTFALTNNGSLTSVLGGGSVRVNSTAGLTVGGTGTIATTGAGANTISLTAAGANALAFTGNQTLNAGAAGRVLFNSVDPNGSISFAGNTTQTIGSGAPLTINTPTVSVLGTGAAVNAGGTSTITLNGVAGSPLTFSTPAAAASLALNGAPVTINAPAGQPINVGTGVTLSSNNALTIDGGTVANQGTISSNGQLTIANASGVAVSGTGQLGSTTSVNVNSSAGSVAVNQSAITGTLNGTAATTFSTNVGNALTLGSIGAGSTVDVTAASMTHAGTSAITGSFATLTATAGSIGAAGAPVRLSTAGAAFSATGNAYVRNTGDMAIAGSSAGGVIDITTVGTLTRSGGTISGNSLILNVGSGSTNLNTNIATLTSATTAAGQTLTIANAGALSIGTINTGSLVVSAGGAINTTSDLSVSGISLQTTNNGNIALNNNVTAANIILNAGGAGTVTQVAGTTVNGGTASVTTGASFTLNTNLANLGVSTSGTATIQESNAINLLSSNASTLNVTANGAITNTGVVNTTALSLTNGAGTNAGISLGADAIGSASVILTVDGTGALGQTGGVIRGGTLTATSGSNAALTLTTDVNSVTATTPGQLNINETNGVTLNAISATGLNVTAGGAVTTANALSFTNDMVVTAGGAIDSRAGTISARNVTFTSAAGDVSTASLTATGGNISATANGGSISAAAASQLTASSNVLLTASQNIGVGNTSRITAGTIGAGFDPNSTDVTEYAMSAITSTGLINLRSGNSITVGDNVEMRSYGADVQMWSGNDVTLGTNSTIFSQGGNIWINATDVTTVLDNAAFTAVARILPGTMVLDNQVIPNYAGGGIAIYSGLPNLDLNSELATMVSNRIGTGYSKVDGTVNLLGSTLSFAKGGSIEMLAPGLGKIGAVGSTFTADGGVIKIDPPGDLIDIRAGGLFLAFAPELVGPPPAPPAPVMGLPLLVVGSQGSSEPVALIVNGSPVISSVVRNETAGLTARSVPSDTTKIASVTTNVPITQSAACVPAPMANYTEGTDDWSVATGACQSFAFEGDDGATVISEGGTSIASKDNHSLKIKQGKLLAVSGKQDLNIETEQGTVILPAGSAAMVQRDARGFTRIAFLGGEDSSVQIERDGHKQTLTAKAGEEMIVAESNVEDEELIPTDGVERVAVSATIRVANLQIRKSSFNRKTMFEKEKLVSCTNGCFPVYVRNRLRDMKAANSVPVSGADGGSKTTPVAKSHLKPVAAVGSMPSALMSSKRSVIAMDTDGASIRHTGDAAIAWIAPDQIELKDGEILVVATKRTSVVTSDSKVIVEAGSVSLINNDDGMVRVATLWNNHDSDVTIQSAGRGLKVAAGNETVVAGSLQNLDFHLKNDDTARRRVVQSALPSGKQVLSAEVSFLSLLDNSTVLKSVLNSKRDSDHDITAKLCKMAVILSHVTGKHGAYGSTNR